MARVYIFNVSDGWMQGTLNNGSIQPVPPSLADYTPKSVSTQLNLHESAGTFFTGANEFAIQFGKPPPSLWQNYTITIGKAHNLNQDIVLFCFQWQLIAANPVGNPFPSQELTVTPHFVSDPSTPNDRHDLNERKSMSTHENPEATTPGNVYVFNLYGDGLDNLIINSMQPAGSVNGWSVPPATNPYTPSQLKVARSLHTPVSGTSAFINGVNNVTFQWGGQFNANISITIGNNPPLSSNLIVLIAFSNAYVLDTNGTVLSTSVVNTTPIGSEHHAKHHRAEAY